MNSSIQNIKTEVNSPVAVAVSIPHMLLLGDEIVAQPLHSCWRETKHNDLLFTGSAEKFFNKIHNH